MHAATTLKMKDASWLKRTLYTTLLVRRAAIARRRRETGASSFGARLVWALADLVIFRPLRQRLGLSRCRLPVSGAAPISADLLAWFHAIGVPVVEGYGQTECAGVSHLSLPDAFKLGTVGRRVPSFEERIAADGEILVRGPAVFCGYLHDPDATARTVDADGWLHTGDVGHLDDDGYLAITGRKKEIIITSGGKNISPEKVENALKLSPYIKEAVAVGDARAFVSALVQIDYDTVGDWASRRAIPYGDYADLASRPEIQSLMADAVNAANAHLAQVEQVRAFRLLPRELNQDDGELTATQKVRRREVLARYDGLIRAMYGGA
jgi:long-chain acyl-CoA synthetase